MPNILQRARLAATVFRRGIPGFPWHTPEAKGRTDLAKIPFMWPDWTNAQPQWHIVDYDSYIAEGFDLNTLVYSSVMYKARSLQQAPLKAYTGDEDNPEPADRESPLSQLVARPNKYQAFPVFIGQAVVFLNITGNAYILLIRKKEDEPPESMYVLDPRRVYVVPDRNKREVLGYYCVPEGMPPKSGIPVLPSDMMHIKLPNPGDPLGGLGEGLSPLAPAARSADVDNMVTHFLNLFFKKGVMVPGLLQYDMKLQQKTLAAIKERWKEIYGGYKAWAEEVGILDQGGSYTRVGLTFEEMGFSDLDERNETRIVSPFGVPPILIGCRVGLAHATYANYKEARQACWEDTLVPEAALFEKELQYYLQCGDEWVAFDLSAIPALQKDLPALVEAAYKMWGMGTPADVAFSSVGLSVPPIPGGQTSYLPLGVVSAGQMEGAEGEIIEGEFREPEPEPKPGTGETPPEAEEDTEERPDKTAKEMKPGRGLSPEAKRALQQKVDTTAVVWEPKFVEAAEKAFEHDKRALAAILNDAKKKSLADKATVNWGQVEKGWAEYFEEAGPDNWRETFVPVVEGVIEDQGDSLNATFGMQFDVRNLFAEEAFEQYMIRFAQPIMDTTEGDIRAMLQQGMREGWSIPTMQKHLIQIFDVYQKPDLPPQYYDWFEERRPRYRTENIARTETIKASNWGSTEIYAGWGAPGKEWFSTNDNRTRDAHKIGASWGQPPYVVLAGEPFFVGGEYLQYPGDMAGSPANICQCRCTVLPVMELPEGMVAGPAAEPAEVVTETRPVPAQEAALRNDLADAQTAYDAALAAGDTIEAEGIKSYMDSARASFEQEQKINTALWQQFGLTPGQATPDDWRILAQQVEREGYDLYKKYTKEGIQVEVAERRGAQDSGYMSVGREVILVRQGRFSRAVAQRLEGELWKQAKDDLSQAFGDLLVQAGYAADDIGAANYEQRRKLLEELGNKDLLRTASGKVSRVDKVPENARASAVDAIYHDLATVCGASADDPLNLPTLDAWGKMELADVIKTTRIGGHTTGGGGEIWLE